MASRGGIRPAGLSDDEDDDDEFGMADLRDDFGRADTGDASGELPTPVEPACPALGDVRSEFASVPTFGHPREALQEAITTGDLKRLTQLVDEEHLVSVDEPLHTMYGDFPVFMACSLAQPGILAFLLERRASLACDDIGVTPLMALVSSQPGFQRDPEEHEASVLACLKLLLDDPERKVDINARQNQRMTALMFAAKAGSGRVVEELLTHEAVLDLRESQEWTALAFAADSGHGHVARVLLEAGANCDIPNRDGLLASELASGRGQDNLRDLIDTFAQKRSFLRGEKSVQKNVPGHGLAVRKYSELDNILMGINLADHVELFGAHRISLGNFLTLSEEELIEMGVAKVGVRKQIMECICDLHKADWQRSSLPKATAKDKQRKIYFTCPDCITMVASMSDHFKYMGSTLDFLTKQILEHPEILSLGQDVGDVRFLRTTLNRFKQNLARLTQRYREFDKVLRSMEGDPKLHSALRIEPSDPPRWTGRSKAWVGGVSLLGLALGALLVKKYAQH